MKERGGAGGEEDTHAEEGQVEEEEAAAEEEEGEGEEEEEEARRAGRRGGQRGEAGSALKVLAGGLRLEEVRPRGVGTRDEQADAVGAVAGADRANL